MRFATPAKLARAAEGPGEPPARCGVEAGAAMCAILVLAGAAACSAPSCAGFACALATGSRRLLGDPRLLLRLSRHAVAAVGSGEAPDAVEAVAARPRRSIAAYARITGKTGRVCVQGVNGVPTRQECKP